MTEQATGFEFDESASEVLVVCNDCGGTWRAFAWTMGDAEQRAAAHEARCHPGIMTMRDRLAARHAMRRSRARAAQS